MYPPEIGAEIKANPQTRMVFNKVCDKLLSSRRKLWHKKDGAVKLMEDAIALWKGLKGKIDEDKYENILTGFEGNLNDTKIFP